MSDDMDDDMDGAAGGTVRVERGPAIKFGSLEQQARAANISAAHSSTVITTAPNDGLVINQQTLTAALHQPHHPAPASSQPAQAEPEHYELTDSAVVERERQAAEFAAIELRRRARSITVPTNDTLVRRRLRELQQPITLFGERQPGRRDRLAALLAKLAVEGLETGKVEEEKKDDEKRVEAKKAFLTPGPDALKAARMRLAEYSLHASQQRLQREKQQAASSSLYLPHPALSSYTATASTLGDTRPLTSCAFSPTASLLATSSFSGLCKVWQVSNCSERYVLKGHTFCATDVVWHPRAERGHSASAVNLASCGMDGNIMLWPLQPTAADDADMQAASTTSSLSSSLTPATTETPTISPLATLSSHAARVNRVAFHPDGHHLFSSSHDCTYALYDVSTQQTVYTQPGHVYGVYALCVHGDGSLVLTGDMGGVVQLWDVRSGRTALTLTGHARAVLCGGWSSAGWCCVTGSEDHSVRVWDIRGKRCMYVLPAHSHSISSALFMRGEYGGEGGGGGKVSECIVTGSYDSSVRVWDAHTMQMVTQLRGHDRMVMRVAVAGQDESGQGWDQRTPFIASASYDRTWKLYHTTE